MHCYILSCASIALNIQFKKGGNLSQLIIHEDFLAVAAIVARKSTCLNGHCGTIIVTPDNEIIGSGFNQPALGLESNRKCGYQFPVENIKKPKSDRTCCVHAEDNAIIDALRSGRDLRGCKLYFMRVDENGIQTIAGDPYCIACAKMALNNHISTWVLLQESGPVVYDATEYYNLSIEFHDPVKG
jgi:deoxycytidylate deaminase